MTELEIDTKELDKLIKNFPQFESIVSDEIEIAMHSALRVLEDQVAGRTPVNTGALRSSLMPDVTRKGLSVTGKLGTSLVYGMAVEYGRPPGKMPPVEVDGLELWVRRKLGVGPDQSRSVAFAIARIIAQRGTKGAFMFEKGLEAATPAIYKLFGTVPDKAIAKIEKGL